VLADAQTSGGLLIVAMDPTPIRSALAARGLAVAEIGTTLAGTPGAIEILEGETLDGQVRA
jgi:hypothetical protein